MFDSVNIFEQDIQSQPNSMRQALKFYSEQKYFVRMQKLGQQKFDKIILTGMGSSYAASINAGAILRNAGFNAVVEVTSDLLHYHLETITEDTLLIMVSQSGVSGEAVDLCSRIPASVHILAVTNEPESALAKRGQDVLLMHVDSEITVSTRTYLASQILMYMVAKAMTGADEAQVMDDLARSVDYLEESLQSFPEMREKIYNHIGIPDYLPLLGRGWNYTTSDAGALFIREVAKYPSISFESAQFRHGPIEMVCPGFAAMVFTPDGLCEDLQDRITTEIALHGGKVVVIAGEHAKVTQSDRVLVIRQKYVSQELAPIVNILAIQAFADYVSRARGYDVSVFRCGAKVTDVQ